MADKNEPTNGSFWNGWWWLIGCLLFILLVCSALRGSRHRKWWHDGRSPTPAPTEPYALVSPFPPERYRGARGPRGGGVEAGGYGAGTLAGGESLAGVSGLGGGGGGPSTFVFDPQGGGSLRRFPRGLDPTDAAQARAVTHRVGLPGPEAYRPTETWGEPRQCGEMFQCDYATNVCYDGKGPCIEPLLVLRRCNPVTFQGCDWAANICYDAEGKCLPPTPEE